MNRLDRAKLLRFIDEVSFALCDCVLYLDTHPMDQEALTYYEKCKCLRKKAVDEYTECYGPLTNDNVKVKNKWTWVNDPWPWEGVC